MFASNKVVLNRKWVSSNCMLQVRVVQHRAYTLLRGLLPWILEMSMPLIATLLTGLPLLFELV